MQHRTSLDPISVHGGNACLLALGKMEQDVPRGLGRAPLSNPGISCHRSWPVRCLRDGSSRLLNSIQCRSISLPVQGLSYEEATANFWVLDAEGLVTVKREKQLGASVEPFARKTQADPEGEALADTVKRVSRGRCSQRVCSEGHS